MPPPHPPSTVSPEPEYGTFHGERGFAVVIKVRDLEMGDYPGLSERAKCEHKVLRRSRQEGPSYRRCDHRNRGKSDVAASQGMQAASRTGKGEGRISPYIPQTESALPSHFRLLTSRTVREYLVLFSTSMFVLIC